MKKTTSYFLPVLSGLAAVILIVLITVFAISSMHDTAAGTDFIYQQHTALEKIFKLEENMGQIYENIYPALNTENIPPLLTANLELLRDYTDGIVTDEDRLLFRAFSEDLAHYQEEVSQLLDVALSDGDAAAQTYAYEVVSPLSAAARQSLQQLSEYRYADAQSTVDACYAQYNSNSTMAIIICSFSCILCLGISIGSAILNFFLLKGYSI